MPDKPKFCTDCRYYDEGQGDPFQKCLHALSQFPNGQYWVQGAGSDPDFNYCSTMRSGEKCGRKAMLWEPRE